MTGPTLPPFLTAVPVNGAGASPPPAPNRRTFAWLALGVASFIVYGSLVPFNFHQRPWNEVVEAFVSAMTNRIGIDSRSDAIANVMIAVPLGFVLLGMCRVDRDDRGWDLVAGLLWLPACVGLAVAVEFAQLYVPSRTCAGSDVWCQGLGAVIGMAAWVSFGRELTSQARVVWGRTQAGGTGGRLLLSYLVLLAFIQALPLDLNSSPKDVYKKIRDEARFVPFGEFRKSDNTRDWEHAAKLAKLAGLYLPVGLLAATMPSRAWMSFLRVLLAAAAVACGMESLQVMVHSRTPSATDAVVGTAAGMVGWCVCRWFAGVPSAEAALALGQLWAAVLLIAYWQPFNFHGPAVAFDWLPGMPLEGGNPLSTGEELLTKVVLFAPFGVLVEAAGLWPSSRLRMGVGASVGAVVAVAIEVGQRFLPSHTPCITDVLIGGVGGALGAWVAGRARDSGEGNERPRVY